MADTLPNIVFLDCESKKISTDFKDGWGVEVPSLYEIGRKFTDSNVFSMGMAVAATNDNEKLQFWCSVPELLDYLLSDKVDMIVTYNGHAFDFPLILGDLDMPKCVEGEWQFSDAFTEVHKLLRAKSWDMCRAV